MPSSLPRRSLLLGLVAAPLTLAACSKDKKKAAPAPSSSSTTTTTTAPAPAKPAVTGKGLPKDLLAVMGALYLGGKVPATGAVATALAKRKPLKASLTVSGTTGKWMGSTVASIVHGKDVTLLVKGTSSWSVVGGWWPSMSVYRPDFPTMRVLAIGSDARTGQPVEKCRGDALHIIGVDHKGVGGIVGIPRDSWVPLSTGGSAKVNAALVFGGAKGQLRTIERASGVKLDGYVITGFKGFRGMVDSLGGIIFVSKSSLRSVDNFQIVRAGTNKLTAKTALALARERKHLPNGDFGRSANQGELIKAGMVMAQKLGPAQLARLLGLMGPHLATSLTPSQVLNLCAGLYLSDAARVPNRVVPGAIGTREGQSVVLLGSQAHNTFSDMRDGRLGA
jgi:LCP family protein required for cell wall assembly